MYISEMLTKKPSHVVVGFVRKHPKHSLPEQRRLMEDRGITKIYDDLVLLIRQRRPGHDDAVAVKRLMLLAEPGALRKLGGQRQSLRDTLSALEKSGAEIIEMDTERRSGNPADREAMILDAIDELSRSRARSDKVGRPRRVYSTDQMTIMRQHWFDHRLPTNRDAIDAIRAAGVRVSTSQVSKILGPSKRVAGNPSLRPSKNGFKRRKCVVYFVQSGDDLGPIKIGIATNIRARLSSLQVSSYNRLTLIGTVPGDGVVEAEYHAKFAKYRLSGEWFECKGALAQFVKTLRK